MTPWNAWFDTLIYADVGAFDRGDVRYSIDVNEIEILVISSGLRNGWIFHIGPLPQTILSLWQDNAVYWISDSPRIITMTQRCLKGKGETEIMAYMFFVQIYPDTTVKKL